MHTSRSIIAIGIKHMKSVLYLPEYTIDEGETKYKSLPTYLHYDPFCKAFSIINTTVKLHFHYDLVNVNMRNSQRNYRN